jgi:hypothetical protein
VLWRRPRLDRTTLKEALGKRLWLLYVTALLLYFGFLISPELGLFFNSDDSTNLFKAWIKSPFELVRDCLYFWSGAVRPIGQIAYRIMYWMFGWHSIPFRVTCLVILEANLLLTILFVTRLSPSYRFRVVAPLAAAFHGALWSIYGNTGTIYDMFCLSFILTGLIYYASARDKNRDPNGWDLLAMSLSTIAAFESKEIGFMLPALFVAMEVIFYSRSVARVSIKWLCAALPAGLCACVGAAGLRYSDNGVFFQHGAYTPSFTMQRYGETLTTYLHLLSFKTVVFSAAGAFLILTAFLAIALLMRSRVAVFGWVFFILTLLPLSFAPARQDGYVLYIPYVGAAIMFAALIPNQLPRAWVAVICGLVIWVQVDQRATAIYRKDGPGNMVWIEQLTQYASTMCREWAPGSRVAVFNNPFGNDWQAEFVFNLTCNRRDIRVDTLEDTGPLAQHMATSGHGKNYSSVARYEHDGYRAVTDLRKLKTFVRMNDALAADYIVRDISEFVQGGWRWAFDRPELQFFLAKTDHLELEVDYSIAGDILKNTGPVTVSFFLNDKAVGSMRCVKEGQYKFIQPAPPELLSVNEIATVGMEMKPVWVSPKDGQHLSIILTGAGFVPRGE